MKRLLFLFILFTINIVFAQSSAPRVQATSARKEAAAGTTGAATRMPTKDEVDVALKRTLGYDPALDWTVYDIRPSVIPGVADVLISINKQAAQHIYMSTETQNAIIGELIPFGPNPFVAVRAKLQAVDGPSKGAQNPQILIVGFSDLECPHCKAAEPVLEKLMTDFPQVRFVFQQFPLPASLHPWAMKAAEYADCAARMDKEAFWKYVNTIFENQGGIALATADDQLKGFATAVGLDGAKVAACAVAPETEARVKKSLELGESLDINETPTVFINGRRVRGIANIPYEQLKTLVQFEIDHAGK